MSRHLHPALLLLALAAAPAAAQAPGPGPSSVTAASQLLPVTSSGAAAGGVTWVGRPPAGGARRIVTLAPSMTDYLVALGATDRIVGVTRVDHAPEVADRPRVGGFLDPSPEAVLGLKPDLVLWVTDGGALSAVRRLAELSGGAFAILAVPVITVADVTATARLLGDAIGEPARGEALAARLQGAVEGLRTRAAGRPRPRVLFAVGREPLVVAGPGSFPDELLRLAGAENAVGGSRPWPVYPLELAVAADPDLVIDAAFDEPAAGISRLSAIPAVRRGAVARLVRDDLLRAGPRMIEALGDLEQALRGAAPAAPPHAR
jgi:iron complex transport system substrate-binding protein